ncbi:MAG: sulfotransferase family protein [Pseudomonadota bacterium]
MNKILALWATPRSTSTAFERAMSNRGDMTCFHEPYNEAYYYGEDRRNDRYFKVDPELQTTAGLTITGVHKRMLKLAETESVFIKDFAYSIIHLADEAFLDAFTHTFLIRDPKKMITSMHARWPDLALSEIGYDDLHTLFNRISDREGMAPAVIDSDELLANPVKGMQLYCESVGIKFLPESLSWEKKNENPTWNSDEHNFHERLKESTGLKPQKRDYPPLESSKDMMRLYKASLPHYEALFELRQKVS